MKFFSTSVDIKWEPFSCHLHGHLISPHCKFILLLFLLQGILTKKKKKKKKKAHSMHAVHLFLCSNNLFLWIDNQLSEMNEFKHG
jgi:hypothetical protein